MTVATIGGGDQVATKVWANSVADDVNANTAAIVLRAPFVNGTYTPTLANMVIGTGGTPTNTASYTFVGAAAGGVLTVEGKVKFGTTGTTLPGASAETISLPAGYSIIDTGALAELLSNIVYNDVTGGVNFKGTLYPASATTLSLLVTSVSGAQMTNAALTATIPFAWAINDEIYYKFAVRATGP